VTLASLAAQVRVNLGAQLGHAERLAQVVIRTKAQSRHRIVLAHARREEDDGRVHASTNLADELKAVHAGHHHVTKQEVKACQVHSEDLGWVSLCDHLVPIAREAAHEQVADGSLVVHHEYACHHNPQSFRRRTDASPAMISEG
jgi:hypothetical protein